MFAFFLFHHYRVYENHAALFSLPFDILTIDEMIGSILTESSNCSLEYIKVLLILLLILTY